MNEYIINHKKNIYILMLILFMSFLLGSNLLNIEATISSVQMEKSYLSNDNIRLINYISLILDSVIFILIIFIYSSESFGRNAPPVINSLILFIVIILISLVWIEMYTGSKIYYGEIRDKQSFPNDGNNFGLMGTFVLFLFAFNRFDIYISNEMLNLKLKLYIPVIFFLLQYIVAYLFRNELRLFWLIYGP